MRGQKRVVGKRHTRHRRMPVPFLGNKSDAVLAAAGRPVAGDVPAVDRDHILAGAGPFACQRFHQLVLAIAGDTGNPQHLAGAGNE